MKRHPVLIATLCCLGLPLLGIAFCDRPLLSYLEFPPLTRYVPHAPFSWPPFIALALLIVATLTPFIRRLSAAPLILPHPSSLPPPASSLLPHPSSFPWWGWLGLAAGVVAWVLAWTRFAWFAPLQAFTFSPLWFAYIVVVNALLHRRTGHCMLIDRPRYTAGLFVVSAAFWWFFEYLNRFVQNWYYVGIGDLTRLEYVVFATLPFATVLPAVMGTYELLASVPRLSAGLTGFAPVRVRRPRVVAAIALAAAAAGLAGIGVWPDVLFPLLWLAPLIVITSLQALRGHPTIFAPLAGGDWRRVFLLALAALICGFFWEMWNYPSLAKWIYAVPYVNRFHLFEMPLVGYAGYLPFGLECAVVADGVLEWLASPPSGGTAPLGGRSIRPWLRRLARGLVAAVLFAAGVSYLPYLWCSRGADRWFDGELALQARLGRGVEAWIERGLSRSDFKTGSRQFDGEWLFGSYLMAGLGFVQTAREHPELRERHIRLAETCIARLLTPEVRAFDAETWGGDAIDTLAGDSHHAAYLGYLNLLLGAHRALVPDSRFAATNDAITAALARRLGRSRTHLLESYPGEVYPVDNCAVIASIALHARITGNPGSAEAGARGLHTLRRRCIDPATGLLYQATDPVTGAPADEGRGSGTALGLYFLSFADAALARDLYRAADRELARTVLGFGGVREYAASAKSQGRDIDSGPVLFGFGLSPTGFLIGGARIHGDRNRFSRLFATAYAWGAPFEKGDRLNFVTGASLGDAILFAMLTAQPAEPGRPTAGAAEVTP